MKEHFVRLKVGLLDHCEDGRMTPTMLAIFVIVLRQLNYETGFWHGSAAKVQAAWGGQMNLRTIQHGLAKLCEDGYLKSFHQQGQRKNYPVAVHKYPVRFGKWKGYRLDASATTAPESPIYFPDADQDEQDQRNDSATTAQRPRNDSATTASPNARIPDSRFQKTEKEEREKSAKAEIAEHAEIAPLSPGSSDSENQEPEKPSTADADYRKFRERFNQEAAIAATHTQPMRTLYADLVATYSEVEVLDAIPEGVARQRRYEPCGRENVRQAMAEVVGANEREAYVPPPLKDKWAARKFLADDAEDIIEEQRTGKPSTTEVAVRNARRPDGTYEGELPMLSIPDR